MKNNLTKPVGEVISFMSDVEPSEYKRQLEEQEEESFGDKLEEQELQDWQEFKKSQQNKRRIKKEGVTPKEQYITLEELQERRGIKKKERDILTEEEIVKLKMMLKHQAGNDFLDAGEMEKLQKMIGSTTKGAFTSPTIARMMPSRDIIASQKEFLKGAEQADAIAEDEFAQETREAEIGTTVGSKIILNAKNEFMNAKKRCPKCNKKTKMKQKVLNTNEGKFVKLTIRCRNNGRKWYWLWLRKPKCDYYEEIKDRID